MDGKRIFLGIDISEAARAVCASHIDVLRRNYSQVRVGWERREKLHVTLKFLGPTSGTTLAELKILIAGVTERRSPFRLQLGATGSFPERGKPRVLWVGVKGEVDKLIDLQNEVEQVCSSVGFEREPKAFHPHITIGRVRDHRDSFA